MQCIKMLQDSLQREQAINPEHSYLVQAPAGSGKTELLTQRFLRLLSLVNDPEQIVAITFTKKAANEMRQRIVKALQNCTIHLSNPSPHQEQTRNFAKQALARSNASNWQLLDQPHRLRILTIDSLCHRIAHAIPLEDTLNPFPEISETPEVLYQNAAESCLHHAITDPKYQHEIKILLKHLDNQQETLFNLFVELLQQRLQWMSPLHTAKSQTKAHMEKALIHIEQHELNRFKKSIPRDLLIELHDLARRVADINPFPQSPLKALSCWKDPEKIDRHLTANLSTLLLTSQNNLRKSFDHHVGIKKEYCSGDEYNHIKSRSKSLLEKLEALPDFYHTLLHVKKLPEPCYGEDQWEVLQALFSLLPLLVAHLSLQFQEHAEVDFEAIAEQALRALGEEDNPTDLSLYLDNSIHHLLIDEFQDTSIQQFHLISRLISGWEAGMGKSLFIVGDPMQSIYRFRAAEVGLFLQAKMFGIGSIRLIPLQLTCNFRSTQTIVEWVNDQFQSIFPKSDDIESGAVSFHPSIHTQSMLSDTLISATEYENNQEEADALIEMIRHELNHYPNDSIAVLVRSRNQLPELLKRLRVENIPFQGVDIDLLANLPHLRDIWTLTQALLMPNNRLVWLSFLRSPWCGIELTDLLHLAQYNKHQSIFSAIQESEKIQNLSTEGHDRCRYLAAVFSTMLARRHQQTLVHWVINTLELLHYPHILTKEEQEDLEQFWILLEKFSHDGILIDIGAFKTQFEKLYSKSAASSRLQIMTIHKSKGLEFDCVILPSLSKKAPPPDRPLLRWMKIPSTEQQNELFLISPMKAAHQERSLLYDYIGQLETQKNNYELQRLFYVATTRSKKRLYLTDVEQTVNETSFRYLLKQAFNAKEKIDGNSINYLLDQITLPECQRLPISFYQQTPINQDLHFTYSILEISDTTARRIGVITHEILQWMCDNHITTEEQLPINLLENRLYEAGFTSLRFESSKQTIIKLCTQFLTCPIGRWILQPHQDEHNEYALLIFHESTTATKIIDRTFQDGEKRWIIDFKTGNENIDNQKKYHHQLNQYADILSQQYQEPIFCGIYYLVNNHWDAWAWQSVPDGLISAS